MVTFLPECSPMPAQLTVRRKVRCRDIRPAIQSYSKEVATRPSPEHRCPNLLEMFKLRECTSKRPDAPALESCQKGHGFSPIAVSACPHASGSCHPRPATGTCS